MKERNYGLDFLRYIAMFGIVFVHVCSHWFGADISFFEGIAGSCFLAFPLLTGYANKGKYSVGKIISYYVELLFYSVVIALIFGKYDLYYTTPLTAGFWWYASVYFVIMLFLPLLKTLPNKGTQIITLLGGFVIFSLVPVLTYSSPFEVGDGMSFVFMFYMVYLGRVLKEFKTPHWSICLLGFVMCMIFPMVLNQTAYYQINSPYVIAGAVFLFWLFKQLPIKIKISAKYAWPVYLIHCHPVVWALFEGSTYGWSLGKCFIYAVMLFIICLILALPYGLLSGFVSKKLKKIPPITKPLEKDSDK